MVIYIDVDETICVSPENRDYNKAVPIRENIDKANKFFDEGHTVVYWTARGSTTGIDWREFTIGQLKRWGAKYTELKLGKPIYDVFIDDKNMNSKTWLENE